ncbi:A49-like RNA polymerase I associated factor [Nesidiocoris tenuis]|uniref:A49-like RNA polymerase I associated factor n=1 Tax=Nesidiocoris tenuis TaxID=355587 RepID=A0ABN7B0L1_9HEMI|nr:A49-like RNA polymerase I associated factor [Nesidiocoris tenuis]
MNGSGSCVITSVTEDEGTFPAISVNFDSRHLNGEEVSSARCHVLVDPNNDEHSSSVVLASHKAQLYEGTMTKTFCKNFLLIRNRKTGQARLCPYISTRLVNRLNITSSNASSSDIDGSTLDQVVETFGSKRQKRKFALTQKMRTTKPSDQPSLDHSLVAAEESIKVINQADSSGKNIVAELLPVCDRNANSSEGVYDIKNLLSEAELSELSGPAELFLSEPPTEQSRSEFLVYDFFNSLGSKRTLQQVQLLLYANSLLSFTRLSPHKINLRSAATVISPHSKITGSKILTNFTTVVGNKRIRTPKHTDKAICHAMIAIILACGLKLNREWFIACLPGCRLQRCISLMNIVGLSPEGNQYYSLKFPLPPLPSIKLKKKR